jgi:hypothetical protein
MAMSINRNQVIARRTALKLLQQREALQEGLKKPLSPEIEKIKTEALEKAKTRRN